MFVSLRIVYCHLSCWPPSGCETLSWAVLEWPPVFRIDRRTNAGNKPSSASSRRAQQRRNRRGRRRDGGGGRTSDHRVNSNSNVSCSKAGNNRSRYCGSPSYHRSTGQFQRRPSLPTVGPLGRLPSQQLPLLLVQVPRLPMQSFATILPLQ